MTEETTSLVLEHLRYMRGKLDRIDFRPIDLRLSRVELRLSAVEGHLAQLVRSDADQNAELDRANKRLDRIKQRLGCSGRGHRTA